MNITSAQMQSIAHISDETIRKDIADTRVEVMQFLADIVANQLIANANEGDKKTIALLKIEIALERIANRTNFIEYLEAVLERRDNNA